MHNTARLIRLINSMGVDAAKAVLRTYDRRASDHAGRMAELGFESLPDWDGQPMTADGREVIEAHGQAWALRPDVHAERLAAALAQAEQRERMRREQAAQVEQPAETERIAATTCPQMIQGQPCGGALNYKPVCGACVTGRMGYRHRYTCESCGLDIVTREEMRA